MKSSLPPTILLLLLFSLFIGNAYGATNLYNFFSKMMSDKKKTPTNSNNEKTTSTHTDEVEQHLTSSSIDIPRPRRTVEKKSNKDREREKGDDGDLMDFEFVGSEKSEKSILDGKQSEKNNLDSTRPSHEDDSSSYNTPPSRRVSNSPSSPSSSSFSAITPTKATVPTTGIATDPSSASGKASRAKMSFRRNLSEMKQLIHRSRSGDECIIKTPRGSKSRSMDLPQSSSPNSTSSSQTLLTSSTTSGGSLIGRLNTALTDSTFSTQSTTLNTLPAIKVSPTRTSEENSVDRRRADTASEDSTELSDSYYLFSRVRFPISEQEEELLKENFHEEDCYDRLLTEEKVKSLQQRYVQSVFVKKDQKNLKMSNIVTVMSNYVSEDNFGASKGVLLNESSLRNFPLSEQNLLDLLNYQVSPSYGLVYSRVPTYLGKNRNVHLIEAVSPVLIMSPENAAETAPVPQFLSVITKTGFILTFKRVAPSGTYPRPSPPWTLVEEPEQLLSSYTDLKASHRKSRSKSNSSMSSSSLSILNAPKSTTVEFTGVIIESVLAELNMLVLPNYLNLKSKYAKGIIQHYLYPHHFPHSGTEAHTIHTVDHSLASSYDHTLHISAQQVPKEHWWTRSTSTKSIEEVDAGVGFCRLLPNGTPWFEINGMGRGDLFQYVFNTLNTQLTGERAFFNPLSIPRGAKVYNPQEDLLAIKNELLHNWRLCAECMQPPACQVARTLASLYIYRLIKILFIPLEELLYYMSSYHSDTFDKNRKEAIQRINHLAQVNGIRCEWEKEDGIPRMYYLYNKLATLRVIVDSITTTTITVAASKSPSSSDSDDLSSSTLTSYLLNNSHLLDESTALASGDTSKVKTSPSKEQ